MSQGLIDIDYKKQDIQTAFQNQHYVVPEYQREYVWEETQIEQLLQDIEDTYNANSDKIYFTGMMVVYVNNEKFEIIDGQQRMTTFFILLCAIIELYKRNGLSTNIFENCVHGETMDSNGNTKDDFALELQYEKSTECLANVFHNTNIPNEAALVQLSKSDQRIYSAYSICLNYLQNNYSDVNELKRFAAYFFRKVQFVQIISKDISDALKIFETINERGVGLNPMDLLKNMLFMQVSRDQFTKLNAEWKKIIEKLEQIKEKPLRFLRYFITASYDITDKKEGIIKGIISEGNIYPWFVENEAQCQYRKDPFGFIDKMDKAVDKYADYLKANTIIQGNQYLKNITHLAGTSYKSHLVLLMAAEKMEPATLVKFKQVLESVIYYYVVNRVKANETEKMFASWCPIIRTIVTIDDLKAFVNNTLAPQVDKWKTDKNHRQNFLDLNTQTMQQYRVKFILARLTKYVDEIRSGGDNYEDVSICYGAQYQVEHIMPQKCDKPSVYGIKQDEFSYYLNLLGNLSLLEKTINASFKNEDYCSKSIEYPKSCFYLTSSIPKLQDIGKNTVANQLNSKMQSWDKWTKKSIEERQLMLYKLSEEIWSLQQIQKNW